MEIINKEGKDLEIIIKSICEEYNISKEEFYYTFNEKKNGLFNKNSVISVKGILRGDLIIYVKEYLQDILSKMGLDVTMESRIRENCIYIKIFSNNNAVLIGRNGNTLKSLENIVKQKVTTEFGVRAYINLDVENYKEKQQKRLEYMAKKLAKEVVATNMEVHLENMNAYDRRIIHNVLVDFKGVKTISEGEDPNRHIVIKPE